MSSRKEIQARVKAEYKKIEVATNKLKRIRIECTHPEKIEALYCADGIRSMAQAEVCVDCGELLKYIDISEDMQKEADDNWVKFQSSILERIQHSTGTGTRDKDR